MKPSDVELRNQQRESAELPLFEQSFTKFEQGKCAVEAPLQGHEAARTRAEVKGVVAPTEARSFSEAHARLDDPAPSHAAAKSVTLENLGRTKDHILTLFRALGPMTDESLVWHYKNSSGRPNNASPSGIRSRRAWLVSMGFVDAAGGYNEDGTTWGEIGKTASGRNCTIWRLK